jgi:ribosomal protein S12 methylthiotransferase accessory factor
MTSPYHPDPPFRVNAVRYRGEELGAPKLLRDGCQRSVPPEETLRRLRPLLGQAGITRLANITGLDRVGVPVTMAVRPNGRTLSNSAGKGLTLQAALVSGAMEALETYHAEEWAPRSIRRPYTEMQDDHVVPSRDELPLTRAAPFPEDWPYAWTWGWDLLRQEEVALPVSMIHMGNRATTRIFDLCTFQTTSNGLASGNNLIEAIHAGLLEVIERDAVTCHQERWITRGTPPPVMDLEAVQFQSVRQLADRFRHAEIDPVLLDCAVDTGVAVYMAYLFDRTGRVAGRFRGEGAHLDPELAMLRALTEAAQARAVFIAGSRDDLFRHREAHIRSAQTRRHTEALAFTAIPGLESRPESQATPTFEGDVCLLLEHLHAVGLRRVIVVDLSSPYFPIRVVKVVVPGLEGYRFESYSPGRRATAFAALPVR